MKEVKGPSKFVSYATIYLLIAVSGMPFFIIGAAGAIGSLIATSLMLVHQLLNNRIRISNKIINFSGAYLVVFVLLFTLQALGCGFFPILNFNKFLVKILLAIVVLIITQGNFFKLYVNTLYVLGIIGLTIHVATFAVPPLFDFLINSVVPHIPNQPDESVQIWHNYHIIIHDFWQRDLFRNSGPFWEPGANAGFTLLALFFNMYIFGQKASSKVNMLFIIVVLSTLSTTGYIVLTVIMFLNPQYGKNIMTRLFSLIIVFIIAGWAFATFDFIGVKVLQQIDNTDVGNAHSSRFASARLDYETFLQHPLGFSNYDYRNGVRKDDDFRTNGVFIFLTGVGFVAFFFYFILVFRSFKQVLRYFNSSGNIKMIAFYFVLIQVFMGFSENYFERPLFIAFSMLAPFFLGFNKQSLTETQVSPVSLANS